MIEKVKVLLGDSAANYTDAQVTLAVELASSEAEAYCRRELDAELELAVVQMAVVKLNRIGTEGAAALSFSGVSESYTDGYPANIMAVLNRKRKLKVL